MATLWTCRQCRSDRAYLTGVRARPSSPSNGVIRVADLFCGLGGLSLGVAEACRRAGLGFTVSLAIDADAATVQAFEANLPTAHAISADVEQVFDGALGAALTDSERQISQLVGEIDLLVGGPPCQGVSSLNNHTRMADSRNGLYARLARAAQVLRPRVVLIENVPGVSRDVSDVVQTTIHALQSSGYATSSMVLPMDALGVPQRRRRFVVLASLDGSPGEVFLEAMQSYCGHVRTVAWAIEDLVNRPPSGVDLPSTPTKKSLRRMEYLLKQGAYDLPNALRPRCHQGEHSYSSMYGRLAWDQPAQTITSGFGSMGQGRFVHPGSPRTLTPHEAARLQTIPDLFRFPPGIHRARLAEMIANAVPPLANVALGSALLRKGVLVAAKAATNAA